MSNLGNKEIFARNLKHYMALYNIDRNTVCKALGFKYSTLSEWLSAKKYPRIDKIELLADYFNIQKSDLIEGNESIPFYEKHTVYSFEGTMPSEEQNIDVNQLEQLNELIKSARGLSADKIKALIQVAENMK